MLVDDHNLENFYILQVSKFLTLPEIEDLWGSLMLHGVSHRRVVRHLEKHSKVDFVRKGKLQKNQGKMSSHQKRLKRMESKIKLTKRIQMHKIQKLELD